MVRAGTVALLGGFLIWVAPALFGVLATSAPMRRVAQTTQHDGNATIRTDRTSYVAGEPVTIFGTGFTPGESVMLEVVHRDGTTETGMGHEPWWVYADANGNIQTSWAINARDSAGVDLTINAAGSSGSNAQTAFSRTAAIRTDRTSYRPGDTAQITAEGFSPNERVTIQTSDGADPLTAVSDQNGKVQTNINLPAEDPSSGSVSVQAVSTSTLVSASTIIPFNFFTVIDQQGPNDQPGQKDMTRMGRDESDPTYYKLFWSWDDTNFAGQVGDACALFSKETDGGINLAVCGQVQGTGPVTQTTASPSVYTCNPSKNDRCQGATNHGNPRCIGTTGANSCTGLGIESGQFITLNGGDADLSTNTDPFEVGSYNPYDTTIQINIPRSLLATLGYPTAHLVNVCSYPSGPGSSAGDCILSPGGGYLVIVKDAGSDTSTHFSFNVSPVPEGQGTSFSVIGSDQTDPIGLNIGTNTESVSESVPADWQLTSASCTLQDGTATGTRSGDSVNSVTIQSGQITTCTFVNGSLPQLELIKNVINNNGGTAIASDWTLAASGGTGAFSASASTILSTTTYSSTGSTGKRLVQSGVTYTLSESGPAGYSQGTWECSGTGFTQGTGADSNTITLNFGGDATCAVTNDDIAPTLTLIKNVINDNGGDATANQWMFAASGDGGFGNTSLSAISTENGFDSSASTGAQTVQAGVSYGLSESSTPGGYAAGSWTCTGSGGTQDGNNITLTLAANVTCRLTNNDIGATLELIKNVKNDNGGINSASDWTLSATGTGGFTDASLSSITAESGFDSSATTGAQTVQAGVLYTLSESATPTGYTAGDWECTGTGFTQSPNNSVTLSLSAEVVCRLTNDDDQAAPTGTTVQSWILHDTITITNIRSGATGAVVNFRLYSDSSCTSLVGSELNMPIVVTDGTGVASTSAGIPTSHTGTFWWQAEYTGDSNNAGFTTPCSEEATRILAKDADPAHNDTLP